MWKKWQKAEGEGPFSNSLNESDSHKWFCINVENHLAKSCWGNLHGPSHKEGNLYFEWKDLDLHRNQSQTQQSVFSTQSIPLPRSAQNISLKKSGSSNLLEFTANSEHKRTMRKKQRGHHQTNPKTFHKTTALVTSESHHNRTGQLRGAGLG